MSCCLLQKLAWQSDPAPSESHLKCGPHPIWSGTTIQPPSTRALQAPVSNGGLPAGGRTPGTPAFPWQSVSVTNRVRASKPASKQASNQASRPPRLRPEVALRPAHDGSSHPAVQMAAQAPCISTAVPASGLCSCEGLVGCADPIGARQAEPAASEDLPPGYGIRQSPVEASKPYVNPFESPG